jgi:hypothetical protein
MLRTPRFLIEAVLITYLGSRAYPRSSAYKRELVFRSRQADDHCLGYHITCCVNGVSVGGETCCAFGDNRGSWVMDLLK